MKNRNKKKPKSEFKPSGGKHPREPGGFSSVGKGNPREPAMPSAQGQCPSWHLHQLDFDGPFCPKQMDTAMMLHVHQQLSHFETRTWSEIESSQNHAIEVWKLSDKAQQRLREIELDDIEEVFSLRLGAKLRVFGIRDHAILRLLWWDPEHRVYKTKGADN